jgi:hypothetical protein
MCSSNGGSDCCCSEFKCTEGKSHRLESTKESYSWSLNLEGGDCLTRRKWLLFEGFWMIKASLWVAAIDEWMNSKRKLNKYYKWPSLLHLTTESVFNFVLNTNVFNLMLLFNIIKITFFNVIWVMLITHSQTHLLNTHQLHKVTSPPFFILLPVNRLYQSNSKKKHFFFLIILNWNI